MTDRSLIGSDRQISLRRPPYCGVGFFTALAPLSSQPTWYDCGKVCMASKYTRLWSTGSALRASSRHQSTSISMSCLVVLMYKNPPVKMLPRCKHERVSVFQWNLNGPRLHRRHVPEYIVGGTPGWSLREHGSRKGVWQYCQSRYGEWNLRKLRNDHLDSPLRNYTYSSSFCSLINVIFLLAPESCHVLSFDSMCSKIELSLPTSCPINSRCFHIGARVIRSFIDLVVSSTPWDSFLV